MDEILIDEKKYISSKRAAKLTGYAKDYIGQLCREGRVTARLVGRSWYVLEAAIQDHRFGATEEPVKPVKVALERTKNVLVAESPRYQAEIEQILPTITRVETEEIAEAAPSTAERNVQDSWKAWFDRVQKSSEAPVEQVEVTEEPETVEEAGDEQTTEETPTVEDTEEVNIPIHTMYQLPPEDLLPNRREIKVESSGDEQVYKEVSEVKPTKRRLGKSVRVLAAVIAIGLAFPAVVATGYFDTYLTAYNQISSITGISEYIK